MRVEWDSLLLSQRFSVADGYVKYLEKRVKRAIELGEMRLAGDLSEFDTSLLRDVYAERAILRLRLTMRSQVISAAQDIVRELTIFADLIDEAPDLSSEEREDQIRSGVDRIGRTFKTVVDLTGDDLRGRQWFGDDVEDPQLSTQGRVFFGCRMEFPTSVDMTTHEVSIAFQPSGAVPTDSAVWHPAGWDSDAVPPVHRAEVLVGRSPGVALSRGSYDAFVKVSHSPELPVFGPFPLTIVDSWDSSVPAGTSRKWSISLSRSHQKPSDPDVRSH